MQLKTFSSVPLWESVLPNFNVKKSKIIEKLMELRKLNPGVQISNINGYHSPSNLHQEESLKFLFDYFVGMGHGACVDLNFVDCDVYITTAWSNFNDNRSCMNVEHVHGETFSGCFYIQIPENSGRFVLENPGINKMWQGCHLTKDKNVYTVESMHFYPVEGQILLWPSYLPHSVTTNKHDDCRISLAFNLLAVPKGRENVEPVEKKVGLKKFNNRWG